MNDDAKPGGEQKQPAGPPADPVPRQRVLCPTCKTDITPSVRAIVSPYHTGRAEALILPVNCPECNAVIVRIKLGSQIHLPGN